MMNQSEQAILDYLVTEPGKCRRITLPVQHERSPTPAAVDRVQIPPRSSS
jgi:hypothetical protein